MHYHNLYFFNFDRHKKWDSDEGFFHLFWADSWCWLILRFETYIVLRDSVFICYSKYIWYLIRYSAICPSQSVNANRKYGRWNDYGYLIHNKYYVTKYYILVVFSDLSECPTQKIPDFVMIFKSLYTFFYFTVYTYYIKIFKYFINFQNYSDLCENSKLYTMTRYSLFKILINCCFILRFIWLNIICFMFLIMQDVRWDS
jgi:hypothetical protein